MKKVLIVDDASVVRFMIKKILMQGDFEIVGEAVNGIDALTKYKELRPDIVTMDITMPEADGIQATKDIIAFDENAKVVIMSGIEQKEMLWQAIKAGAASYIVKPFENDRVISTLNEVIEKTVVTEFGLWILDPLFSIFSQSEFRNLKCVGGITIPARTCRSDGLATGFSPFYTDDRRQKMALTKNGNR